MSTSATAPSASLTPLNRHGVTSGWKQILEGVVQDCSARASAQRT